jgi:hypothetical protein
MSVKWWDKLLPGNDVAVRVESSCGQVTYYTDEVEKVLPGKRIKTKRSTFTDGVSLTTIERTETLTSKLILLNDPRFKEYLEKGQLREQVNNYLDKLSIQAINKKINIINQIIIFLFKMEDSDLEELRINLTNAFK